MKNVHILFLGLFLLCGSFVFSQTQGSGGLPNDLDSKYTPDKASLFNSSSDGSGASKGDDAGIKNVVSFDIVNLARSAATIYYERSLHKILSVQVGIGALFAKDQVQQTFIPVGLTVFNERNGSNSSSENSTSLTDILKNSSFRSPGIFLSAGIKLYVSGTAPKGVYFQVGTTYAVSNLTFNTVDYNNGYSTGSYPSYNGTPIVSVSTGLPVSLPNVSVKNLNFNFTWGYQFVVGVGKVKFVNTVYAGIGVKKITYTDLEYTSSYNQNGNTTSQYQIGGTQTVIVPSMIVGFSVGLGW